MALITILRVGGLSSYQNDHCFEVGLSEFHSPHFIILPEFHPFSILVGRDNLSNHYAHDYYVPKDADLSDSNRSSRCFEQAMGPSNVLLSSGISYMQP